MQAVAGEAHYISGLGRSTVKGVVRGAVVREGARAAGEAVVREAARAVRERQREHLPKQERSVGRK
jgi:hypothetical protein